MPSWPKSTPPLPPAIDLSEITEHTRRTLYDIAVAIHFSYSPGEVLVARRAGAWITDYGPDECGLTVVYLLGRWFIVWRVWEVEDDAPESHEWTVLVARPSLTARYGVEFYEV